MIIKQNDTHNALLDTLYKDNKPLDLTGCTVCITIGSIIFEDECHIMDAENGQISYLLSSAAKHTGTFYYEYIVKYSDGTKEIVPNDGYNKLRIVKRLGVIE